MMCFIVSLTPRMIRRYQITHDSWNSWKYAMKFSETGMHILRMMPIKVLAIPIEHRSMGRHSIIVLKGQIWGLSQNLLFVSLATWIITEYPITPQSLNSGKHTKKFSVSQNNSKSPENFIPKQKNYYKPQKRINFIKSMENCLEIKNTIASVFISKDLILVVSLTRGMIKQY